MPNAAYALALVLLVLALSVWYHYRLLVQTEVPLLYLTSSHDMDKRYGVLLMGNESQVGHVLGWLGLS